jgi:hypothetical protein
LEEPGSPDYSLIRFTHKGFYFSSVFDQASLARLYKKKFSLAWGGFLLAEKEGLHFGDPLGGGFKA